MDKALTEFVIIGYTSSAENAEDLKRLLLQETHYTGEIYVMHMGSTMGTHAGLNAVSMFFIGK